jgi:hypothetical protein
MAANKALSEYEREVATISSGKYITTMSKGSVVSSKIEQEITC